MKKRLTILIALLLMAPSVVSAEDALFTYEDHGKRDPFWPLVSPTGTPINYDSDFLITDLVLEGIIADKDGRNLAIINGRVLGVDGQLGDFTVLSITSNSVTLSKGEQKFDLKLKKEE